MNGNQAYTRGWQMGMNMVQAGQRKRQMGMQRQQFQKEISLRERRVKLLEEAKSIQEKGEAKRRELLGLQIEEQQNKMHARNLLGEDLGALSHFPQLAAQLTKESPEAKLTRAKDLAQFKHGLLETPEAKLKREKELLKYKAQLKTLSPDKLRELDVVSQSVNVSPQKLRDGTLTSREADTILKKLVQMRKWTLLGAILGLTGEKGMPGFTEKHPLRPLDDIIK